MLVSGFVVFLVIHGLIHLLGAAKGFGLAALPQLTQPIPPARGALWLLAAVGCLGAAVAIYVWPRWWWAIGACAVVVSMAVIVPSWADAKVGALANLIVLAGVAFGFLAQGPFSLRAEYDRDVAASLTRAADPAVVTDRDLAPLPGPVQRYLRLTGVVGQPRVRSFRVRMHGRIRSGRDSGWMPFTAEQVNTVDLPARHFYLNATMLAVPVQGYHRYVGEAASMRVRAAAVLPVATAAGAEMTRAETVTLFNDMCIMAPATLIDPAIQWELLDAGTVRARFTNAGHTIGAVLSFDEAGMLADFVSDDRVQTLPDGTVRQLRWSTPVRDYRPFGAVRLASHGEGRWHDPAGAYAYIDLTIDDVSYSVAQDGRSR